MTTSGDGVFMSIRGAEVSLRPLTPRDYEPIFQHEMSSELGRRSRLKGVTPDLDAWVDGLWRGVLAQFIVSRNEDGRPLGLVTAYNANVRDEWVYFGAVKFSDEDRSAHMLHGVAIFVAYLFETWNFGKLYVEVSGYNLPSFASAIGSFLNEEGLLKRHEYAAGQWWGQHILALYRQRWEEWEPIVMPAVLAGEKFRQTGTNPVPTRDWPSVKGSGR